MVKEIERLKILPCLSLLFVIALGLAAIVTTGCGDGDGSSVASNGQTPSLEVLINQIDTTECPTIKAYVSVKDQDGTVVEGLTDEEFSVFEDGDEQLPIVVEWSAPDEQYIVSYNSSLTDGGTHDLGITVEYQGLSGSDSRQFTACIEVLINQIDTTECPTIKAYVSVTDQDGVIPDLTEEQFSVFEDGDEQLPIVVEWPAAFYLPISVCLAMDYSGSMTNGDVAAMEEAAVTFVKQMTDNYDWGEIIKFAGAPDTPQVEVFQEYTNVQQDLIDAIYGDWVLEDTRTALFDAIYKAIEDTALQGDRRAVVAITDGMENCSDHTLDEVINHAVDNEVPVFTIRLGWADPQTSAITDLKEIAEQSGGKYFYAPESDDLEEIYLQISEMVVLEQYIISYSSALTGGGTHDLQITVEYQGLSGSDSRQFTACP